MTEPKTYHFTVVPSSQLSSGNRADPFRFYHNLEPVPVRGPLRPDFYLEVVDSDGDRQVTTQDQFFYHTPDNRRLSLPSGDGIRILNYLADPTVLTRTSQGLIVHEVDGIPKGKEEGTTTLSGIHGLSSSQREAITDRPVQFWEVDGHIDLDILEGKRIFTEEENDRWTDIWPGIGIYLSDPWYVARRGFAEKGLVAGIFLVGEHFINPTFMWQMYTTNFTSMWTGSFINNSHSQGTIHGAGELASHEDASDAIRRMANIRTADARRKVAEDHAYWVLTWPVVIAACFADPNFRRFWPAPWRVPRFSVIGNYFDKQFRTAVPAIGRTPKQWVTNYTGLGLLAASGFGIYEVSSAWFDIYGGLKQGTTENRVFAGGSTVLIESALYARASREMTALRQAAHEVEIMNKAFQRIEALPTLAEKQAVLAQALVEREAVVGSGVINWANIKAVRATPFRYGVTATIPEGSLLARGWSNWPRFQAFFNGRRFLPTVEVGPVVSHSPLGKYVLNKIGFPQISLEARIKPHPIATISSEEALALESNAVRAEAAGGTLYRLSRGAGAAQALEGRQALYIAEEVLAARRVRLVGLPLLAIAAGIGLGIGVGYATGHFDDDYTPRDMFRNMVGK